MKEMFLENIKWIFSGIGVFILGLIITNKIIQNRFKISTKGDKSPGYVGRDYKVNENDRN